MFNCVKRRCLVVVVGVRVMVMVMIIVRGLGCLLELINLIGNMWRRRR
jgi:hypothetical protein